jgi:hypothetical protein
MPERRDYLLCRRCGVLIPLAPSAPWPTTDEDVTELAAFRAAHEGHAIEAVQRRDELARTDRPAWDPLATRWFEVAVGGELLTVRSTRDSVDEPRQYQLASAGGPAPSSWVDVDEALLRRALDRHFYPHVIRPGQLDAFVSTVRDLVAPLDPAAIDIAFDDPTLPDAGIGAFPAALAEQLVARCADLFDPIGLERARSFIRDHRTEDGALAVRVHRVLVTRAA